MHESLWHNYEVPRYTYRGHCRAKLGPPSYSPSQHDAQFACCTSKNEQMRPLFDQPRQRNPPPSSQGLTEA